MTAQIINGTNLAKEIKQSLKLQVKALIQQGYRPPCIAVILVGHDPASEIYVKNKHTACENVGMKSISYLLSEETTEKHLLNLIEELNQNTEVDGILVQLPLPQHINADNIIEKINPKKDVDGFHPYNLGRLAQRRPLLRPCTPYGVIKILESTQQSTYGLNAVVVGASNIVGRPMALELLLAGCTTTICHRFTPTTDLMKHVSASDIVISAVGKPHLIKGEWIKPGCIVIDVGITRMKDGSLQGDIEFESAKERAAWITPVPGGVGPMTIAMLLENTLQAYKAHSLCP